MLDKLGKKRTEYPARALFLTLKTFMRTAFLILTFWGACVTTGLAQLDLVTPVLKSAPVSISLLSEVKTAIPGQAFQVAVRVTHQEHWHTWENFTA